MSVPRPARGQADTVYWRHDAGGPDRSYDALWTDEVPVPVQEAIARHGMSREQIRNLPPPLPQIVKNPARTGYPTGAMEMVDILALRRGIIPFGAVSQDGGGGIATSQPSSYTWW